jgi:hypothetical protein
VHGRQRLAVHRPGEQDLGAARLVERDRAPEALGGLRLRAEICAVEAHVLRLGNRMGEPEHVGERDPGPGRGARGARAPRRLAGDVTDRDQARAPVAGALERGGHLPLPERLAEGGQGELQLALHEPVHAQAPAGRVDLRHRPVPADVERVRRRHRTLGQGGEPGLGVERLLSVDDQVGALSVASHGTSVRSQPVGWPGRGAGRPLTGSGRDGLQHPEAVAALGLQLRQLLAVDLAHPLRGDGLLGIDLLDLEARLVLVEVLADQARPAR